MFGISGLDHFARAICLRSVAAIRKDHGNLLFFGFPRESPVRYQNKIAVFLFRPEVLVRCFAMAVVIENPVLRRPVTFLSLGLLPTAQVNPGIERMKTLISCRDLVR